MRIDCCLFANYYYEHEYIEEWCEHHLNLGVSVIHIIDDVDGWKDCDKTLKDIPYISEKINCGKINYLPIPGHISQHILTPWFYNNFKNYFDWCCFFDTDEFLFLPKHKTIQEFINDESLGFNNNCDVIQVGWRMYGPNGHIEKPKSGSVLENFYTNPDNYYKEVKSGTKVIVRGHLNNVRFFIGHVAMCNNRVDRIKYSTGEIVNQFHHNFTANYDNAYLAHFHTKSLEEFIDRSKYGYIETKPCVNMSHLLKHMEEFKMKYGWSEEHEKLLRKKIEELAEIC